MSLDLLARKIQQAESFILTTHRQSDGDGLGAEIALFHALKSIGKKVRIINVDATPKKYAFLGLEDVEVYLENQIPLAEKADIAVIFDTNDLRLVEPLYSMLKAHCREIFFVDHHPILEQGPMPPKGSYLDTTAASTGELAFNLIRALGIPLNKQIARGLYTAIAFDTQVFRYVRGSTNSHLIAAELLKYEQKPELIHRSLFANFTPGKIEFLAKTLQTIEYFCEQRIAVLHLSAEDLLAFGVDTDESRDVVDLLMNIDQIEAAVAFREDGANRFKISIRSKGRIEVLAIAELLGGGGHLYSSGAFLTGTYGVLKSKVVQLLANALNQQLPTAAEDESA